MSKSATMLAAPSALLSFSRTADSTTPNIGVIKLKTETTETSLYFSRIPQTEYATAETKPR